MNGFKTSKRIAFLMFACILISAFITKDKDKIKLVDFKNFYDSINTKGCMVIYDTKNKTYYLYDSSTLNKVFTPASTFKIPSTLMALETGTATDENFEIKWDSIERWSPNWSKDHTLKMAFQNSTVWYYQELARRMGSNKMKELLDKMQYGNMDTSGGVDLYWLTGGMRISPMQEIDFLRRLHTRQLPLSERTIRLCENIMLADSTSEYKLRAKTGWSATQNPEVAWYVGYFETKDNVYYFANLVFPNEKSSKKLFQDRKDVVYKVFKSLGLLSFQ